MASCNYTQIRPISSEGAYGIIRLVECNKTKEKFVMKFNKNKDVGLNELEIMRQLGSYPMIIKLHDAIVTDYKITIILEYIEGCNLKQYGVITDIYLAREIFKQLGQAIEYCHEKGIIHSDIKPENVMIDNENNITLIDFGLSYVYDPNVKKTSRGTPLYYAPEEFNGGHVNFKKDIYAYGVTIYECLVGHCPYDYDENPDSLTFEEYRRRVLNDPLDYTKLKIPPYAKRLIAKLLTKTPSVRPTMKETLSHIFFTSRDIL